MYPIIFFTIAFTAATTYIFVGKKEKTIANIMRVYLNFLVFFCIGIQGILAAFMHTFFANFAAAQIGWATGSPFQFEVAMANLAIGIVAILSLWFDDDFRLATVLMSSIFLFGAAYGHMVQMGRGDMSPYNSGVFLYVGDVLIPLGILILMLVYYYIFRKSSKPKELAPTSTP